jgi:serine acetyltransferase
MLLSKVINMATQLLQINKMLKPVAQMLKNINRIIYACDIGIGCYIPKSCKFPHSGLGYVIHANAILGENVVILSGVTIGADEEMATVV